MQYSIQDIKHCCNNICYTINSQISAVVSVKSLIAVFTAQDPVQGHPLNFVAISV